MAFLAELVVNLCSCGSAAAFLEGNLTNIRVVIVLETATTLGALTGVLDPVADAVCSLGWANQARTPASPNTPILMS